MSEYDKYFQTTSSLDEYARKARKSPNKSGDPIRLPSKILAVAVNPYIPGDTVHIAESAGTIKTVSISSDAVTTIYTGPTAPLTSLCFTSDSIWAGCWDKTLWRFQSTPAASRVKGTRVSEEKHSSHADFVKCVLTVRTPDGQTIILSGGADGDIIFWSPSGSRLYVSRGQSRSIEHLALDPISTAEAPVIFVATSQRDIHHFTLPASTDLKSLRMSDSIIRHETSVYKLHFDSDGDLWTASADKTAQHLVREEAWKADTTLKHPDFVRDVVTYDRGGWVITACRDEEVRVWNKATGHLHHVFSGHFEEVTGLCVVGDICVSVSIDATIRKWSLKPQDLSRAVEEAKTPKTADEDKVESARDTAGMLTAEEEAVLQALMADEEAEMLEKIANDEQ